MAPVGKSSQPLAARLFRQRFLRNQGLLVEDFCGDDYDPMPISDGDGPHMHGDPVPCLVAKVNLNLTGFSLVYGSRERAGHAAKGAGMLVTVRENILAAGTPKHLVASITGDLFRAVVPEKNLPIAAD